MKSRLLRVSVMALAVALMVILNTGAASAPADPASAAGFNDSFWEYARSETCTYQAGRAYYVDYGEGGSAPGPNDDYMLVEDLCADGHGVKAWVWLNGVCLESCSGKYNGNGKNTEVFWDPFPGGLVKKDDLVGIKVCIVDGASDPTPTGCGEKEWVSQDG